MGEKERERGRGDYADLAGVDARGLTKINECMCVCVC